MKKGKIGIIILAVGILLLTGGVLLNMLTKQNVVEGKKMADEYSYQYVAGASRNYVVVSNDGKYGYAGLDGEVVIPISYNLPSVKDFYVYLSEKSGLFIYTKDDLFGVVDKNNKVVLEAKYAKVEIIDSDTFLVQNMDNSFVIINREGKETTKRYVTISAADKNMTAFIAYDGNNYGLIDNVGVEVVPFKYKNYRIFEGEDNKIVICFEDAEKKETLYFYDTKAILIDEDVEGFNSFKEGYVYYLTKDSKPIKYSPSDNKKDDNFDFNEITEDVYMMVKDGKVGYIDNKNKNITEYKYDLMTSSIFKGSYAVVGLDGKVGVINKEGKEVVPIKYNSARVISNLILASLDDKDYLLNGKGEEVISAKEISYIEERGVFVVYDGKNYGILTITGEVLYEQKYLDCNYMHNYIALKSAEDKWILVTKGVKD